MKKMILFGSLVLVLLSLNVFALEFQMNANYGIYSKYDDLFKQLYGKNKNLFGFGMEIFFLKFTGFYLDASYMTSSGESSLYKQPLTYKEIQLSAGGKMRLTLFRFSPMYELNLYAKGGVLFIIYSETFEEKISGNVFGFTAGSGLTFWLKKIGIGFEVMINFARKQVDIQGLNTSEDIDFGGFRVVLKGVIRF